MRGYTSINTTPANVILQVKGKSIKYVSFREGERLRLRQLRGIAACEGWSATVYGWPLSADYVKLRA